VAVLLLTLALHAGIAWAISDSGTERASAGQTNAAAMCESTEDLEGTEEGEGDSLSGGSGPQSDPARATL
jgi:hypothetical protein